MIKFKFDGIEIEIYKRPEPYEYTDSDNKPRVGYNKNAYVIVKFWDFVLKDGDLFELSLVKSTTEYFKQAYWKRSSKEGSRILLQEELIHENVDHEHHTSTLSFNAVQKAKINKLHIRQTNDGTVAGEIYLTGRQVIQLDIAISRAISLMSPDTVRDP
jgi:hypothetical protein